MKEEVVVAIKHRDQIKEGLPYLDAIARGRMREVILARSCTDNSPSLVEDGANSTVVKVLERKRLERKFNLLAEELGDRHCIVVGKSPQIHYALNVARKAAPSKSTILLLGESGTGKEIFARAIHNWSDRKDKPLVAINCVGLSRELLESQLFGHEKGAFTGAIEQKKGKMELAHGGTVFLDEVGDISTELQTKLLRFLQEREFERVGGTTPISVDVRIIAATNRDLDKAVR
ncbi:MAG TPA: sigma-54 factor interaction domain-containing protein, partial [Candidatus Binatia bacterium]|nr:sigma-54 factor interaction domain-containing protein [Candidatus Binatia bacterium]